MFFVQWKLDGLESFWTWWSDDSQKWLPWTVNTSTCTTQNPAPARVAALLHLLIVRSLIIFPPPNKIVQWIFNPKKREASNHKKLSKKAFQKGFKSKNHALFWAPKRYIQILGPRKKQKTRPPTATQRFQAPKFVCANCLRCKGPRCNPKRWLKVGKIAGKMIINMNILYVILKHESMIFSMCVNVCVYWHRG